MALVLGRLRVTPRDFWMLTVPELDTLLHGAFPRAVTAAQALDRTTFDGLRARIPD